MLSANKGKRKEEYLPYYVIFDLETTGISPSYDRIIEISAVKVENHQVTEEFSSLVNPQKPIPMQATIVNGISNSMVASAPTIDEVLPAFLDFIGDNVLIGHNIASFDLKFIYRETERIYGRYPDNEYIDTLSLARRCLPELSHHKLTDLSAYYHIPTEGAHRALNDCRMNQKVYECLGQLLMERKKNGTDSRSCPRCGMAMVLRKGRYGQFWGCTGYPGCRYTENM